MTEQEYKYVPHHCRDAAEAEGWRFSADLNSHHSAHASLYERPVEEEQPIVQLVITKTKGGAFRVVEQSAKTIVDVKEFTQPQVLMMVLRNRIEDLAEI